MLSARSIVHAEAREPIGIVAQHRAIGATVEIERGLFHEVEEGGGLVPRQRAFARPRLLEADQLEPAAVDRLPHFGGERDAYRAGVRARIGDAIADRRGIVGGEGEIFDDVRLVDDGSRLAEPLGRAGCLERAVPFRALRTTGLARAGEGRWQASEALRRLDNPGEKIGAFHVTRKPEDRIGRTCQHERNSILETGFGSGRDRFGAGSGWHCRRSDGRTADRSPSPAPNCPYPRRSRCPWCRRPGWN